MAAKTFTTSISIAALPDRIWSILTDAAHYQQWNTTIDRIEGSITPGGTIDLFTKAMAGRAFALKVTLFDPPTRMVWTGGLPLGLFRGTRVFTLVRQPDASVVFSMTETFTGLMAPLIARSIPNLQPSFDRFASDLKRCAETSTL